MVSTGLKVKSAPSSTSVDLSVAALTKPSGRVTVHSPFTLVSESVMVAGGASKLMELASRSNLAAVSVTVLVPAFLAVKSRARASPKGTIAP